MNTTNHYKVVYDKVDKEFTFTGTRRELQVKIYQFEDKYHLFGFKAFIFAAGAN